MQNVLFVYLPLRNSSRDINLLFDKILAQHLNCYQLNNDCFGFLFIAIVTAKWKINKSQTFDKSESFTMGLKSNNAVNKLFRYCADNPQTIPIFTFHWVLIEKAENRILKIEESEPHQRVWGKLIIGKFHDSKGARHCVAGVDINCRAYKLRVRDWVELALCRVERNRSKKLAHWMIYWNSSKCAICLRFSVVVQDDWEEDPAGLITLAIRKLTGRITSEWKSKRHDDKLLFSSKTEDAALSRHEVCQMCHRKLPPDRFPPEWMPRNRNNYWNIPMVNGSRKKIYAWKEWNVRRENLGNGIERKSDFPLLVLGDEWEFLMNYE